MGSNSKSDKKRRPVSGGARPQAQHARPTIGLLIEEIGSEGTYQAEILTGITTAARELNVNLLCCRGGALGPSPHYEFESQRNEIYDLISTDNVDGLIVPCTLGNYVPPEEFRSFLDRYRPLPIVSIAQSLPGIPSVLVDNGKGMRDLIVHLIETHGHRRIAFIRGVEGSEEAEQRYRAYVDALAEYGLPHDPALVVQGDFLPDSGAEAARLLLDQGKLQTHDGLDAIVAANDNMAIGALEALEARGVHVPSDVAVVGFDDTRQAEVITPSLTTVRQPLHAVGRQAVEAVLALIAGEEVVEQMTLPTEMVTRQSCGCMEEAVAQAEVGPVEKTGLALEAALAEQRENILSEMVQAVIGHSGEAIANAVSDGAGQLLDSFTAEMKASSGDATVETPGIFLQELGKVLRQVLPAGDDAAAAWQGAISAMRRHLLPHLGGEALSRAEDLWQQARVLVGETARRAQAYQVLQVEQQEQTLRGIGHALITTFDVNELMGVLAEGLPQLGIPSAYLSLYKDPDEFAEWSWLMLAYDESGRVELEPGGQRFPSRQLVPEGLLAWGKADQPSQQHSFMIEPLYFRERQLGFALFEIGPREGRIYEAMRGETSNALMGALLLEEQRQAEEALAQAYTEVERQVQERTAELQREIAEREKAQDEALHLQMEVIEAQKRAIQELSTPIIPVLEGVIVMPLIGSVDSLRARDLTRRLLAGIREHRARVVILDITGVPIVDSGVASHLNKTIQAARLKGARTIVTGISDAVAETIVDLGIDWTGIDTLADLQTGLRAALAGFRQRAE